MRLLAAAAAAAMSCLLATSACEKANAGSGPLGRQDLEMLAHVPGGNMMLVGGNYMRLQNVMQSALGKTLTVAMERRGLDARGLDAWISCVSAHQNIRMAGGIAMHGWLEMRFAMTGLRIDELAECATRAGFVHEASADGRYLSLEVPAAVAGKTQLSAYLALPDGAIYYRTSFGRYGTQPHAITRTELEGDVERANDDNATADKHLIELSEKVDRSKTLWVVGSGTGTLLERQFGDWYGWLDVDGGVSADFHVSFAREETAETAERAVARIKRDPQRVRPALAAIIDAIKLDRDGNMLHIRGHIDEAQIAAAAALSRR